MKVFISNLRSGNTRISQEQRQQILTQDQMFFDKKRTTFKKYNMKEKVSHLVDYFVDHNCWPTNSYTMTDGFPLGVFKVNTQRSPPKTMLDEDKQKILHIFLIEKTDRNKILIHSHPVHKLCLSKGHNGHKQGVCGLGA